MLLICMQRKLCLFIMSSIASITRFQETLSNTCILIIILIIIIIQAQLVNCRECTIALQGCFTMSNDEQGSSRLDKSSSLMVPWHFYMYRRQPPTTPHHHIDIITPPPPPPTYCWNQFTDSERMDSLVS